MTAIWTQAALWLGLALIATLLSIWLKVATALSEIVVGTIAQLIIGAALGGALLANDASWLKFLAGAGAIVLTFLAGAELDPAVFRRKWKEAGTIGLIGFVAPFLGCTALARWAMGWSGDASWLAGIAMSTTSVAVVYAVMLEFGLNVTEYGKVVLAACFVNDLTTVLALGFLFAPFSTKTLVFVVVAIVVFAVLPWVTPRFFRRFGNRASELEAVAATVGAAPAGPSKRMLSNGASGMQSCSRQSTTITGQRARSITRLATEASAIRRIRPRRRGR